VFLGCLPLWGVHVVVCALVARLCGVSRLTTYLASYVNNPVTLPFVLYVELGLGHWLRSGSWPALTLAHLGSMPWLAIGGEMLVGAVALGAVGGLVLGGGAWAVGGYWRAPSLEARLREEASRRYLGAGALEWEIVRGRLRYDPLCFEVLRKGILPPRGRLVDLGCGRGTLLAVLVEARLAHRRGEWDAGWPAPPAELELEGVEHRASLAGIAQAALAGCATIHVGSVVEHEPRAPLDAVVITDTLSRLPPAAQERALERVSDALRPGGVLLLREMDGSRRIRTTLARGRHRLASWFRRERPSRLHPRTALAWRELLERAGFEVRGAALEARVGLIEAHKCVGRVSGRVSLAD
jgi:SAM-dependent methyltransferase